MRTIDGKPEYRNGLVSGGVWEGTPSGGPVNSGGAPLSFWEFPFSWGVSHHFGDGPCHWRCEEKVRPFWEHSPVLGGMRGAVSLSFLESFS